MNTISYIPVCQYRTIFIGSKAFRDHRGRDLIVLHMPSVPTTTKVVRLNLTYGEVYSIQHYVIKFVIDFKKRIS
jgi:hypothetical protein